MNLNRDDSSYLSSLCPTLIPQARCLSYRSGSSWVFPIAFVELESSNLNL